MSGIRDHRVYRMELSIMERVFQPVQGTGEMAFVENERTVRIKHVIAPSEDIARIWALKRWGSWGTVEIQKVDAIEIDGCILESIW